MQKETTIEGVLERIAYANEDNAWCVVRLKIRGRGQVTAVGKLLGARPGESLRCSGAWVHDRKYGAQFKVESYLTVRPSTFVGMEKYLGSGLVEGVGPSLAKRLVQHFGLETLDVIGKAPERLAEVEGIGPVRSQKIRQAFERQKHIQEVMVFLQSHGISSAFAVKIFKRYGADSVARVRENPFRLAQEIRGIGFLSADRIARDMGIAADSPHRAAAGLLHCLRQASGQGHVYVEKGELTRQATELLEIEAEKASEAIASLLENGEACAEPLGTEATDEAPRAIFLPALAAAEAGLAKRVRTLTAQGTLPVAIAADRAVEWFEKRESLALAEGQRQALKLALVSKMMVLTGGPGTGKTTLVRGIVRIFTRKGLRVLLAAPTGRAAKRLSQAAGMEAKTVHRMLEYNPRTRAFTRDREFPLVADLVVVDEASMLDTSLAFHLLRALPDKGRLILVGDVDQLPSVGPGRVLADLIDSGVPEVARLSEIFRQAKESLIVVNAHRVRQGQMPILRKAEDGADFFFIGRREPEDVLETLNHLVSERIPKTFGFDPHTEIQVLTPMQKGILGAAHLNAGLQALLNADGESLNRGGRLLRVGDRVMQVRNNYDLEVFNGDVGLVASLDLEEQRLQVDMDGRLVSYELSALDELMLAYACSIHKSQGSEYPCVVIPLHTQHYVMLQRNLLYTALTRGRKLVVIIGSRQALERATENQDTSHRATLLAQRLRA
jgi:exodeoxyribonuclease V alpha subunit